MFARDGNVILVVVPELRHFAHGSFVVSPEDFRGAPRPAFIHSQFAKSVHAEIERAAESLPINVVNSAPENFVGMLSAGGASQNFQAREFLLNSLDDLERLGFVIDRENK